MSTGRTLHAPGRGKRLRMWAVPAHALGFPGDSVPCFRTTKNTADASIGCQESGGPARGGRWGPLRIVIALRISPGRCDSQTAVRCLPRGRCASAPFGGGPFPLRRAVRRPLRRSVLMDVAPLSFHAVLNLCLVYHGRRRVSIGFVAGGEEFGGGGSPLLTFSRRRIRLNTISSQAMKRRVRPAARPRELRKVRGSPTHPAEHGPGAAHRLPAGGTGCAGCAHYRARVSKGTR